MSFYKSNITHQDGSFYALIVRVDRDGEENVIPGYNGRFFKTMLAAERSTQKHLAWIESNRQTR